MHRYSWQSVISTHIVPFAFVFRSKCTSTSFSPWSTSITLAWCHTSLKSCASNFTPGANFDTKSFFFFDESPPSPRGGKSAVFLEPFVKLESNDFLAPPLPSDDDCDDVICSSALTDRCFSADNLSGLMDDNTFTDDVVSLVDCSLLSPLSSDCGALLAESDSTAMLPHGNMVGAAPCFKKNFSFFCTKSGTRKWREHTNTLLVMVFVFGMRQFWIHFLRTSTLTGTVWKVTCWCSSCVDTDGQPSIVHRLGLIVCARECVSSKRHFVR